MDLFSAARGSEVQIFTKISELWTFCMSLGQRSRYFTKIQNSGPVFRAHGSEVQIFHERSRTVHLVVHRWVRGPGIFIKFLSFDCIKPRALHGS